jgi:hypothetical protein
MKRALLSLVLLLAACRTSTAPGGDVAIDSIDSGAPDGAACVVTTDCVVGLLCGYALDAGCAATGVCVPEDRACTNDGPVVCACDDTPVRLACIYGPAYAAAPVVGATPGCQPVPFDAGFE